MSAEQEANQLTTVIRNLINNYSKECEELTTFQCIGLLEVIKWELIDKLEHPE